MTKILILVTAVVVIVWLLKRAIAGRLGGGKSPEAGAGADPAKAGQLVACAHCGVNLPQSEARAESMPQAPARFYCSEEHLRAGPRKR